MQNPLELSNKIVEQIRRFGPVLPIQISKQIGSNLLFAGAILSDLVAKNKIKISCLKVGSSPVYYAEGQEIKLQDFHKYLNEKERQIFEILKDKKVLQDIKLEPWQRVAIREIKDFANMLTISTGEVFWKWYLLDIKEAEELIKTLIGYNQASEEPKFSEELKPKKIEEPKEEIKSFEKIEEPIKHIEKKPVERKHIKPERKIKENFNIEKIQNYFTKKIIKVLEENIIKKGKEIDYIISIPSELGDIKFYAKFKEKSRVGDADLSLAHDKSQLKKLPLLFLSNGELTKKAKEYMEKNYLVFENV